MLAKQQTHLEISSSLLSSIEERWNSVREFYQRRGHVLFVSDRYRFWDQYGFTQQSLARTLLQIGVRVSWFDGITWKNNQPHLSATHPHLKVTPLKCYPGRRFSLIDKLSVKKQTRQIRDELTQTSLVWVQGSLDDRIARNFNVDVFSVFDDCELQPFLGDLARNAKLILSQNAFAHDQFKKQYPIKSLLSLPPVELSAELFRVTSTSKILPSGFPEKMMGYLGACFINGFDFDLLEYFIKSLPEWGFLICGRTDEIGQKKLKALGDYSNFHYRPWIPREALASIWLKLQCNLMLYKDSIENRGAYPIKILESLFFGVPSVATRVPKTSSLEGICPVESNPKKLVDSALSVASCPGIQARSFERLFYEMHPKVHLARIAEALQGS